MPKEIIRTAEHEDFDVSIGWQRDQAVQVGVVLTEPRSSIDEEVLKTDLLTRFLDPNRTNDAVAARIGEDIAYHLAAAGLLRIEADDIVPDDPNLVSLGRAALLAVIDKHDASSFDGLYSTLNRREINEVIRVLRRARNSAYGEDA